MDDLKSYFQNKSAKSRVMDANGIQPTTTETSDQESIVNRSTHLEITLWAHLYFLLAYTQHNSDVINTINLYKLYEDYQLCLYL